MLCSLIGDIIGSPYETNNVRNYDFELFSPKCKLMSDSILTLAIASWLLSDKGLSQERLIRKLQEFGRAYNNVVYGNSMKKWIYSDDPHPYNSFANGSAMRVGPIGLFAEDLDEVLLLSKQSAEITHNHPEGIKGAQAIACATYLNRVGATKNEIKDYIERKFGYNLSFKIEDIRPTYTFDVSCMSSVPVSIKSFLEGNDFEDILRLSISVGGDSNTIACMACSIYGTIDYNMGCDDIIDFCENKICSFSEKFIDIIRVFEETVNV